MLALLEETAVTTIERAADLELMRRCAKAMGWEAKISKNTKGHEHVVRRMPQDHMQDCWCVFEPLTDDAQAMALVKKLHLHIGKTLRTPPSPHGQWFVSATDKYEARPSDDLNRAIVECAAMIGAVIERDAK